MLEYDVIARRQGTHGAPGLNTAASATVLAERGWAEKRGLQPVARLVSYGLGAVEPGMFGLGLPSLPVETPV